MLTVAKIGGGDTARQLYYEQEVALSHPAYYTGKEDRADGVDPAALAEPPGVWLGAGADALGMGEVRVELDALRAMCAGNNPTKVQGLAEHACSVSAFDLLFAAPKSVSVAHAVADGETRQLLAGAHGEAAHDSETPPPNPGAGVLLTADEVAALLRVSKAWVYAQTRAGRIPHVRLGRHVRYRLPAIESWVEDVERVSTGQRAPATTRNGRAPRAPAT